MDKIPAAISELIKEKTTFREDPALKSYQTIRNVYKAIYDKRYNKILIDNCAVGNFVGLVSISLVAAADASSRGFLSATKELRQEQFKNLRHTVFTRGGNGGAAGGFIGITIGLLYICLEQNLQFRPSCTKAANDIEEKKKNKVKLARSGFQLAVSELNVTPGQRPVIGFRPNRIHNLELPGISQIDTDFCDQSIPIDESLFL